MEGKIQVLMLAVGLGWVALVLCLVLRVLRQKRSRVALPSEGRSRFTVAVSVIVPVRNEVANIDSCLEHLIRQEGVGPGSEIIVVDDESCDGTADRVRRASTCDARVRLIEPGPLPAGWAGKSHACWRGASAAATDWLCFVDADLRASPQLLATAVAVAEGQEIDMLSLSPFHELKGFWERLVVPAGLLLLACTIDLRRINDPASRQVTANGQFLLCRRSAYFAVGGHRAVRDQICEDKALARLVKHSGRRFRLLGAEHLARTRMYSSLRGLWHGFAKNAAEMLTHRGTAVAAATAAAIVGWATLALPIWSGLQFAAGPTPLRAAGWALCLIGSVAVIGVQMGTVHYYRIPAIFGVLLTPIYTFIAILTWYSLAARRYGRVHWKGRRYNVRQKPSVHPL